jgi:hypothetical protein
MGRSMYTSAAEISDTSLALATRNTVRSCYVSKPFYIRQNSSGYKEAPDT